MPSRDLGDLDPTFLPLAEEFLQRCADANIRVIIDCTYRSGQEQNILYSRGRSTPGHIVTHAQAGESAHNCINEKGYPAARAFDIAIQDDQGDLNWDASSPDWQKTIAIGRQIRGLTCGADFPCDPFNGLPRSDNPHFEMTDWKMP